MTIDQFLEEIIKVFRKSGIFNPENEAQIMACHILSCDKTYLYLHRNEYIDEKILLGSAALINERCKGRPLAYIIGTANFYGYDITVDERVLIPRPETELLAEAALKEAQTIENPRILDLCTGSGCISVVLADKLPNADITASDLSLRALQIARYNGKSYPNINFVRSDLFEKIEGEFDIIVTNPPYVAERDRDGIQREVKDFEPEMALFSGYDGLDLIKKIIKEAPLHLKKGGLLLLEHSEDQSEEIRRLAEADFYEIATIRDLAGSDRYLRARKI